MNDIIYSDNESFSEEMDEDILLKEIECCEDEQELNYLLNVGI